MDSSTLAQRFNDVAEQLQARGHRVVVRRARAFLEGGDATGAQMFLLRARDTLGAQEAPVAALAAELHEFEAAGGDVSRLVTDPAWVEGTAREARLGRMVDAAVSGGGLGALVGELAAQQKALASGEPMAQAPARQVEPSALPPLPKPPGGDLEGRASIGSIFKPGRGRAAVEAPPELEARSLDLDEGETETPALPPPAPSIPEVPDPPRAHLLDVNPSPPVEPVSLPDEPVLALPSPRKGTQPAPMVMPELSAPPEMPASPTTAGASKGGNAGMIIGVIIALAAIAAGVYFALK